MHILTSATKLFLTLASVKETGLSVNEIPFFCQKWIQKINVYMFLSCHVRVSEWIHTLQLPECQGTGALSQV